ncbi:hypothetical protein pdam_00009007 [Pocillopora damicornis]|uniref:Fibrinogen C-terminal domain-containing protein n=1 Tax=Pocillopora damicornis TaxID=46731 RepID=A0A3M6T5T9_POCDA|nr:hypothetical protein pdam_00009007 [Pocillopora damicornis]
MEAVIAHNERLSHGLVAIFMLFLFIEVSGPEKVKIVEAPAVYRSGQISTKEHLYGCFKASREGVEEDGKFCLARVGLFDERGEDLTICPEHRNEFGLGWRPSKVCKYPEHQSK